MKQWQRIMSYLLAAFMVGFAASQVAAEPIDAALAARVDQAMKLLTEWAADPAVVNAVKAANSKDPGDMTNAKWITLADTDAAVQAITQNPLAEKLRSWEKQGILNKLYVRDAKANLLAGSNKALLFNNAARPQFKEAFTNMVYLDKEAKPDPTTHILSVQVAVAIKDGGKAIGVVNSAVNAK